MPLPRLRPLAVYTAIYGGYDVLKPQPEVPGVDYHCFTDDPSVTSEQWVVHRVEGRYKHPRMSAKYFKMLPHEVLPDYRYSLWIDGSVTLRRLRGFKRLLREALEGHGLALHRHAVRSDLRAEAQRSLELAKYDGLPVREQVEHYYAQGYADQCGLFECTVLARDHEDAAVRDLGEAWLRENEEWTYQDQLSLPYLLWRLGIEPGVLPHTVRSSPSIVLGSHTSEL